MVVDFEFRKQVMDFHVASDALKYCYQCNRCTDNCPVSKVTDTFYGQLYDPRANILNSLLGYKDSIFAADPIAIWGCTVCDTCDEVCPQNIELTEIFSFLKNESAKAGNAPDSVKGQAEVIFENAKAIPSQSAIERRRKSMGLPDVVAPDVDEVQTLLKNLGVDKIL